MSGLYSKKEIVGFRLQRVDSTVVTETTKKIESGLHCGYTKLSNKKMVKFSVSFDGLFPSSSSLHTDERYASENNALPEQIYKFVSNHCLKRDGKEDLFIIDRGVCSAETFSQLADDEVLFVGRLQNNRQYFVVKDLLDEKACCKFSDGSVLLEDKIVHLYKRVVTKGKSGKDVRRQVRVEKDLRIVKIQPVGKNETITFVTNHFLLSAEDIALIYRRRWDIEVFFRFIKQELNFSNFISLNNNGIEIVMYMTLIAAMLIVVYKKLNNVGYQTAKRRIGLDLERLIGAILVVRSGGDLKRVGLEDP
jgi:transposase